MVTRETLVAEGGLSFLRGMLDGHHPCAPYAGTIDIHLSKIADGQVVFIGKPSARYLNPVGTIQGIRRSCCWPEDVLWQLEEGLRSGAAVAMLGDVMAPDLTARRRLQLAEAAWSQAIIRLSRWRSFPGRPITGGRSGVWNCSDAPGGHPARWSGMGR